MTHIGGVKLPPSAGREHESTSKTIETEWEDGRGGTTEEEEEEEELLFAVNLLQQQRDRS